jgi:hypothetical protein
MTRTEFLTLVEADGPPAKWAEAFLVGTAAAG